MTKPEGGPVSIVVIDERPRRVRSDPRPLVRVGDLVVESAVDKLDRRLANEADLPLPRELAQRVMRVFDEAVLQAQREVLFGHRAPPVDPFAPKPATNPPRRVRRARLRGRP